MTISITATVESLEQAKELLNAGVDTLYIGEADFALRLPHAFTWEELAELTKMAHEAGSTVTVAVNALMHQDKMKKTPDYLDFLESIRADRITVGDAGVVYVLARDKHQLPYIYDTSTMVTSARQVNFWAAQGAVAAVLARELPKEELVKMSPELQIPGEILVYGATVIHQSKRPLLQNYFNFIGADQAGKDRQAGHFLAEPTDATTHYSIFEDSHGTHIFANDDLNMMTALAELADMGYDQWKLDGIFTAGDAFVQIAKLFVEARQLISTGNFDVAQAIALDEKVRQLHPAGRTLSRGFYDVDPATVK